MNKGLFEFYVNQVISRDRILKASNDDFEAKGLLIGANTCIQLIEKSFPDIKEKYERLRKLQQSFTLEQQDHICDQIGEWYCDLKGHIEGPHKLGFYKEKLKEMIFGD